MAKATELLNSNTKAVDVLVIGATSYYKEGIVGRAGSLDHGIAAQRVGTHADDAAFVPATDAIVAIGALADETATDSVDEGDVGAVRMTLDRRLIVAGTSLDDAAFGVATGYVSAIGALADQTSPDSVDEGDLGALRMTLARMLEVVSVADVATLSNLASATASATALAANANRIGATFYNDDANGVYLKFGATASATSYTILMATGTYYELPAPVYRGVIDALWVADGAGSLRITELT